MTSTLLYAQLLNGLTTGLMLALTSAGLSITYGALGVMNFAHGAFYVLGGYVGSLVYRETGSFLLGAGAGAATGFLVGTATERLLLRRFYGRPIEDQLLVTFGIGMVLVELVRSAAGGLTQVVPPPAWGQGVAFLGFMVYPLYRLQLAVFAAVFLLVSYLVLYRTKLGLIVRAGIEDRLMIDLLGSNIRRTFLFVFGLGAMAAGMAGFLTAPTAALHPDVGAHILVLSFVVIVIGGLGSFAGAVVGGIVTGEIVSLTSMVAPAYADVVLFATMALILIARPQGLLGAEGRA